MLAVLLLSAVLSQTNYLESSSHREAPLIANDPLADNTDVYAFRNPSKPDELVIIANYIPFQLPQGGPNYYFFGEDVIYDIHIKNDPNTEGDDIIYRFDFTLNNEDPTTFFKIRLGKENLKNSYTVSKSTDNGRTFTPILRDAEVPPYHIGPRSIEGAVGLGSAYEKEFNQGIYKASSGESIFAGPVDDPFFADLGAIFDLANIRPENAVDGLKVKNVHTISMSIPISQLQKDGKSPSQAENILDSDFVVGVWASASRPRITVRTSPRNHSRRGQGNTASTETEVTHASTETELVRHVGPLVQVSRLGMPLTNEVIIPIGRKDEWNFTSPYSDNNFEQYFTNPELALYMDDSKFGGAVPGLSQLRIQSNSLDQFDFRNGQDGLFPLLGNPATKGTALDQDLFGNYLLREGAPRSVDLLPIFQTGVPNLPPYQLATGKMGNPLAEGKPFINNFLPTFGDMLRVNMATPVTPRDSEDFSSLGLVHAAVLGLTDPRFNQSTELEFIPNMDGFPNGRRLEDDVTRIELQAVSGVVLAAIGLPYDDFDGSNLVTQDLVDVLTFTTGVEQNDKPFMNSFPYLAMPWDGFEDGAMCEPGDNQTTAYKVSGEATMKRNTSTGLIMKEVDSKLYPNPARESTTIRYNLADKSTVTLRVYDSSGTLLATPLSGKLHEAGTHEMKLDLKGYKTGIYYATMQNGFGAVQTIKFIVKE